MIAVTHADLTYSYRRYQPVITAVTSDNRILSSIEQTLVGAGQAYRDRRFQDAIDLYLQVRRTIWSQLYPAYELDERLAASVDLQQYVRTHKIDLGPFNFIKGDF